MPPRAPGVHTHEEWKGMAQPVGLVVEPVVLNRLGIFPESATTVLADWQQRLEQLLDDQHVGEQWLSAAPSFEVFCQEVLAWQPGDLRQPEELAAPVAVHLDDVDEVLCPDWIVPEPSAGEGPLKAQLLVQELPLGTPFDALPKGADGRRSWEATPQQRLERLLKDSEHPIGLLWNGVALRLVYAPRGESSGHLTFPLEPMTTVDGRPMLAALQMLLGPDRLFEGGASSTRLRPLMEQSRKEQNEVSTRLAEQVLEALWILLRGFDAAGLQVDNPSHVYGGLITVLLRLVFLLYAEDEELMPSDSLYGQHYSVGGLAQRLRQDRADYQNAMEGRRGAWAALLSLFRLVVDGGGPSEAYLPARHGELFDPDAYPFLEGRTVGTSYRDGPLTAVPAISDDVVEQVLTKLLLLDGQILSYRALDVEQITAFLFANGGHDDPKQLAANAGKSFVGSYVLGMGFTFDDSGPADDETPGIPSPIATMERLIAENPKNAEVIFPYIGGEEVNSSPTHAHHRYVINFGERSEEECRREWPELMAIVERKVKPERMKVNDKGAKQKWWQFIRTRPEMYAAIEGCERVLATGAAATQHLIFPFLPEDQVFSHKLIIFPLEASKYFCLLISRVHTAFAKFFSSTLEDRLTYNPSDCFENFPFPASLLDSTANDSVHETIYQNLEAIGERYHQFRSELMVTNNEGLTNTYNRFHDPAETSSGLIELRRLHCEIDQAVLAAYGWSDVHTACGFGLDYLDIEDDAQLPDELQERIDSGELFFWDAGDALDFQSQLQAYGAITGRRKLPWRYRWSDSVRDDVLARLLALNAERYAEEVAMGLHSKGVKQAAKASGGSKMRGRPSKISTRVLSEGQQVEQIGLGL